MRANLIVLIFLAGLTMVAIGRDREANEPIQPVFEKYMPSAFEILFYRHFDGTLVMIGSGGPEGKAIASNDEGRTWHKWNEIKTWPNFQISAANRRGEDLFCHGPDAPWGPGAPNLRVYHSKDRGKTWGPGHTLMQWPKLVAIPNGPRQGHPDEGFRGKALLWSTPGNRIVVNREGHLVISIQWLLGGEGVGPELVGTLVSEDDGVTWRCYELFGPPRGYKDRPSGFAEPKPVLLSDGRMWLVFRTCLGHLWQAFSEDGGRTWGEPTSTGLDAPMGPLHAQRVPNNDAVVVAWNYSKPSKDNPLGPRVPLAFAVSHDHCQKWSRPVIVTEQAGYMYNVFFSDKEMFLNFLEGNGKDPRAEGFQWRHKVVIYDLKDVLALQPEE